MACTVRLLQLSKFPSTTAIAEVISKYVKYKNRKLLDELVNIITDAGNVVRG